MCKRHKDSFFLSGIETIFAAQLQLGNPNPSRFSSSGRFNSNSSPILSGTDEGAIDVSAYQISEQGMGMVQADMIEASVNPNIIRVKPSEGERYVPEVFYRYTNEYKIDVKESAKPTFPVEYLIVNATHGFPNAPNPTFLSSAFPIENRPGLHDQDLTVALTSIGKIVGQKELFPIGDGVESTKGKSRADDDQVREKLVGILSDWHLLAFLDTSGFLTRTTWRRCASSPLRTIRAPHSTRSFFVRAGRRSWRLPENMRPQAGSSGNNNAAPAKDPFTYDGGMDPMTMSALTMPTRTFTTTARATMMTMCRSRTCVARRHGMKPPTRTQLRRQRLRPRAQRTRPRASRCAPTARTTTSPSASDCEICGLPL